MIAHGIDLGTPALRDFCRKWKFRELAVFGSILRDDFRPDSDIDFLADFHEDAEWDMFDHMEMEEQLAGIVGRRVDIVSRPAVERSRNRFRKKHILSTAETVIADR